MITINHYEPLLTFMVDLPVLDSLTSAVRRQEATDRAGETGPREVQVDDRHLIQPRRFAWEGREKILGPLL